jgi:hypothetical protein
LDLEALEDLEVAEVFVEALGAFVEALGAFAEVFAIITAAVFAVIAAGADIQISKKYDQFEKIRLPLNGNWSVRGFLQWPMCSLFQESLCAYVQNKRFYTYVCHPHRMNLLYVAIITTLCRRSPAKT